MKKVDYINQLETQEWENKRQYIFKRDGFKCCRCGSCKELNVHHKKYLPNKKAWQYPNGLLETVCRLCHIEIHKNKSIQSFLPKSTKPLPTNKNERRIQKLISNLSIKDQEIQAKYNNLKTHATH